jgi:protein-S-isoprenylcysteine O-methyltransferase Ste14
MKTTWTNYLAAVIWTIFTGLRAREFLLTRAIVPVFLALQAGMVALCLMRRRDTTNESNLWVQTLAWGSAFLPLTLQIRNTNLMGITIHIVGLCLILGSILALGRSFGIAPADRGLVKAGPYQWLRHPMYAGEILAITGALIGNLSIRNTIIFSLLLLSFLWRIRIEERLIFGYGKYQEQTPWRLLPGIW